MTPEQGQHLTSWSAIMKDDQYKLVLDKECQIVLGELSSVIKKVDYSIMTNEGKKNSKKDTRRNVHFRKVPKGEDFNPNIKQEKYFVDNLTKSSSLTSLCSKTSAVSNASEAAKKADKTQINTLSNNMANCLTYMTPKSIPANVIPKLTSNLTPVHWTQNLTPDNWTQNLTTTNIKSDLTPANTAGVTIGTTVLKTSANLTAHNSSASHITSNTTKISATNLPDKPSDKPMTVISVTNKIAAKNQPNKIEMKLIEGLNQPVNSDKAMKMMLNMGWKGGALGTKGEGITEPIKPCLDRGKRTGFGAVNLPKKQTETANDIKKTIQSHQATLLSSIQTLLNKTDKSIQISFPEANIQKEWEYLKNTVICLNKGSTPSAPKGKLDVLRTVMGAVKQNDWILTAGLMPDRKTIIIHKSLLPLYPNELKLYQEIVANKYSVIERNGTHKDVYKGLDKKAKNTQTTVSKNQKNTTFFDTKDQNMPSGSKDQNNMHYYSETEIEFSQSKENFEAIEKPTLIVNDKERELTEEFKNNVLGNILLFCQTDIQEKCVKFPNILNEAQRDYIKGSIGKANRKEKLQAMNLEARLLEKIINLLDGYTIAVVISSPCSINMEKQYGHCDVNDNYFLEKSLSTDDIDKNRCIISNADVMARYDEDNEEGNGTDTYLDPEQSFVDEIENELSFLTLNSQSTDACSNDVQNYDSNDEVGSNDLQNPLIKDDSIDSNVAGEINADIENNVDERAKINCGVKIELNDNSSSQSQDRIVVKDFSGNSSTENGVANSKKNDDDYVKIDVIDISSGDEFDLLKSDSEVEEPVNDKNNSGIQLKNSNTKIQTVGSPCRNLDQGIGNCSSKSNDQLIDNQCGQIAVGPSLQNGELSENLHTPLALLKSESGTETGSVIVEPSEEITDLQNDVQNNESIVPIQEKLSRQSSRESSGKRSRTTSQNSVQEKKKIKRFVKKIAIVPDGYPQNKIDDNKAREIQQLFINAIDDESELPLLKCYGIKSGTLIYSCHSEKTFNFVEKLVNDVNCKLTYEIPKDYCDRTMAFKINTFVEESTTQIIDRLLKFNKGLDINNWVVIKKDQHKDFAVIYLKLDNKTYSYLKERNFELYSGMDMAIFSHVWE